jgi:hypothetical protein
VSEPECPGEGKCHGCLKWCNECGDVDHVCDARLAFEPCDEHPVPPEWGELRDRRRAAEKKLYDAKQLEREALGELEAIVDDERARRHYGEQRYAEEQRMFGISA